VSGGFAQCVGSTFKVPRCADGTHRFTLPLANEAGTSVTWTTQAHPRILMSWSIIEFSMGLCMIKAHWPTTAALSRNKSTFVNYYETDKSR
jgi:hypothetical protein